MGLHCGLEATPLCLILAIPAENRLLARLQRTGLGKKMPALKGGHKGGRQDNPITAKQGLRFHRRRRYFRRR